MTRKQRASRVLLNAGAVWELINRLNMSQGGSHAAPTSHSAISRSS